MPAMLVAADMLSSCITPADARAWHTRPRHMPERAPDIAGDAHFRDGAHCVLRDQRTSSGRSSLRPVHAHAPSCSPARRSKPSTPATRAGTRACGRARPRSPARASAARSARSASWARRSCSSRPWPPRSPRSRCRRRAARGQGRVGHVRQSRQAACGSVAAAPGQALLEQLRRRAGGSCWRR